MDALVGGFKVRGFMAALLLAAGIALASTQLNRAFSDDAAGTQVESMHGGDLQLAG